MICKICGQEVFENAYICYLCGARLSSEKDLTEDNYEKIPDLPYFRADTELNYNLYVKKRTVFYALIAAICAFIVIVVISLLISFLNRPNITKCISVKEEGYNGFGHIYYYIDEDKILDEVFDKKSEYDLSDKEIDKKSQLMREISSSLTMNIENKNLKNGDEVSIIINDLSSISKKVKIKFKSKNKLNYIVEALQETKEINADDVFSVAFSGNNGSGCVNLSFKDNQFPFSIYNGDDKDWIYINDCAVKLVSSENQGFLSNGDIFTLSFKSSNEITNMMKSNYGCSFSDKQCEFEVSGLKEPQSIDIFSNLEIKVNNKSSQNESINYRWNSDKIVFGDFYLKPNYMDNDMFEVYCTSYYDYNKPLTFYPENNYTVYDEYMIGSYGIMHEYQNSTDNNYKFTVCTYGELGSEPADQTQRYGFVFSPLEQNLNDTVVQTVTAEASEDQLNSEVIKTFAALKVNKAEELINNNWSDIVHGNSQIESNNKEILKWSINKTAYFAKPEPDNGNYTLWIIYILEVKDDLLDNTKYIYVLSAVNNPQMNDDNSQLSDKNDCTFTIFDTTDELFDNIKKYNEEKNDMHEIIIS